MQLALDFKCQLTVLFIAQLEASFSIEGLEEGESLSLSFYRESLIIPGKDSHISVNATLNPENISESEINIFEIDLADGFFYLYGHYSNGVLIGELEMPSLVSYGNVEAKADDTSIELNGTLSIFGGLMTPHVELFLFWDLSYVYIRIGDFHLNTLIVLQDATLEVSNAQYGFALEFKSTLSCLFLVEVSTTFTITERNEGELQLFDIFLHGQTSTVLGLPSYIIIDAELNPEGVASSEIRAFNMSVAADFFTLHGNYTKDTLRGTFNIPALWTNGYAEMTVNETVVEFWGTMTILDGIFKPNAHGKLAIFYFIIIHLHTTNY